MKKIIKELEITTDFYHELINEQEAIELLLGTPVPNLNKKQFLYAKFIVILLTCIQLGALILEIIFVILDFSNELVTLCVIIVVIIGGISYKCRTKYNDIKKNYEIIIYYHNIKQAIKLVKELLDDNNEFI
jgi:hypothetical protein